jgi:nucleoid-associated protein YgaU
MAGTIGIKIANGDFYPIIEENSPVKRRLVLTTVHDRQSNVQIDLFRSISKSMLDAQYIGSLVVETNSSKPKGEPSIEMIISVDRDGNISAEAYDLDAGPNGERHTLNVSLQNIDTLADMDNTHDFEFNSHAYKYNSEKDTGNERKFPWLIMVIAALFIALAISALWFFFLGGSDVFSIASTSAAPERKPTYTHTEPQPSARQETQPIQEQPPAIQPPSPPPQPPPPTPTPVREPEPVVIKAPETPAIPKEVKRARPPSPVLSYKVPAVIPKNGVVYQIQWGDTLWDISAAFYRTPWLYSKIAKDNKIRNPDLILAGSNLRIRPIK